MNKIFALTLIISLLTNFAQASLAPGSGYYIGGSVFRADSDISEINKFTSAIGGVTSIKESTEDTGFAFRLGKKVSDNTAFEIEMLQFETGFSISGAASGDVDFELIPVMVNYKMTYPILYNAGFYGSVGGGVTFATLDVSSPTLTGDDSALGWSYQAFGGIYYRVNDRLKMNLGYRYLKIDEMELDANNVQLDVEIESSIVEASLEYEF